MGLMYLPSIEPARRELLTTPTQPDNDVDSNLKVLDSFHPFMPLPAIFGYIQRTDKYDSFTLAVGTR
jgi:hypothetical protein